MQPMDSLISNIENVTQLMDIHLEKSKGKPGRKHRLEVLNKSAIVLLVASWEAFIEDLAEESFKFLLANASSHDMIPTKVRIKSVDDMKKSANNLDLWQLAGNGWQKVLQSHKSKILDNSIGRLNTPKQKNIDDIFEDLLGFDLSSKWSWLPTMTPNKACTKLDNLIVIRGNIAHRAKATKPVHKDTVIDYTKFIYRLAVKSNNTVNTWLLKATGKSPFKTYKYGAVN